MNNFIKYVISAILAIVLAIVFYVHSFSLPPQAYKLPRILAVLIILLSIAMVIEGYVKYKKDVNSTPSNINKRRVFIFALLIAVYIFTIKPVGYFIVTPIYIIATYLYLKSTSLKNMIIIALGFTAFVYALFVMFLKLPIPLGPIS